MDIEIKKLPDEDEEVPALFAPGFSLKDLIVTVILAVVVSLFIRQFLVSGLHVTSGSMEPVFMERDRLFVNKIAYDIWDEPSYGEIVLFKRTEDGVSELIVKRIVGVGGDIVEGTGGIVLINGVVADETYLQKGIQTANFASVKVPEGYLFLMGDNREHSYDSRSYGPVPMNSVEGKVFVVWWPFGSTKFIS